MSTSSPILAKLIKLPDVGVFTVGNSYRILSEEYSPSEFMDYQTPLKISITFSVKDDVDDTTYLSSEHFDYKGYGGMDEEEIEEIKFPTEMVSLKTLPSHGKFTLGKKYKAIRNYDWHWSHVEYLVPDDEGNKILIANGHFKRKFNQSDCDCCTS